MEKENQRITISKRMLKEGLLRCLKHTEIDKLSISDLCRESGINRATFYHHYQLPKDVLSDIGWEHTLEIKRIFESDPRGDAEDPVLRKRRRQIRGRSQKHLSLGMDQHHRPEEKIFTGQR